MNKQAFHDAMATIINGCLPAEEMIFEVAGQAMVDELYDRGTIEQKTTSGDVEFIQVETAKTVLECIPLICACYKIAKAAAGAGSRKLGTKPTLGELYDLLVRSGAPPRVAQAAVDNCRDALEQLVVHE